MNQEHQLLKAIFDNPTEDTPRLMYADWLETDKPGATQTDRDRAEFIRTQIALAQGTDPVNGGPLSADRTDELISRETVLHQAMIVALGPEFAAIAHAPQRITFNRGFLQNLDLGGTPIARLPEGLHVRGHLNLFRTQITQLPEGLHVGDNLNLGDSPITQLPEGLTVGGYLNLQGTQITELPEGLHVGGRLNLYGIGITREAALRIAGMPGLSDFAKISGLRTAGFDFMANQVARDAQNRSAGRQ